MSPSRESESASTCVCEVMLKEKQRCGGCDSKREADEKGDGRTGEAEAGKGGRGREREREKKKRVR